MSAGLVRLIYPENWTNTFRLIPGFEKGGCAKFGDIVFTTEEVDEADLAVIVNFSPYDLKMKAKEAWIFHHEPSNYKYFAHWMKAYKYADRVFGSWKKDKKLKNPVQEQTSIFWGCPGDYQYYKNLDIGRGTKKFELCAITSSKTAFAGHKERLEFLYALKEKFKGTELEFDIKGKGICEIKTKDELLIPSKYTLAIENTSEPHYFTEKITDAFLCGCMPIYYGAPNIFEYFPEGSLIKLEKLDAEYAAKIIKEAIENDFYGKNYDKLAMAKDLVLNKYNFFINIAEKISEYDILNKPLKNIYIPKSRQKRHPLISKIKGMIKI